MAAERAAPASEGQKDDIFYTDRVESLLILVSDAQKRRSSRFMHSKYSHCILLSVERLVAGLVIICVLVALRS